MSRSIFGTSLYQLVVDRPRKSSAESVAAVPQFIIDACRYVYTEGKDTPNLWTSIGEKSQKNEVQKLIELISERLYQPSGSVVFKSFKVPTVVAVLRTFFLKLPTPLLTFELHDVFLGATQEEVFESKEEQIHFLQRVINCLPDVNRDTLSEMVHLFEMVTKETTREENKTDWVAVFGPPFLIRKGVHEYKREVAMSATLLQLIVDNASNLFSSVLGKSQGGYALKSVSQANLNKLLPRWLNYINQQKLEQVQLAIDKIQRIFEFGNNCKDFAWTDNREFESSLRLIEFKLGVVKEIIEKQAPAQVIDTYHLERFYSYASSFHDALVQAESKGRLARYFESSRLSASMEKLTLSMQYELNLFFDAVDDLYSGTVKNNPKNKQVLAQRTYGCIQDKDGAVMWRDKFGIDRFMVPWNIFVREYPAAVGQPIDQEQAKSLKNVLDNGQTGFVTVYKFAEYMKVFGPFKESIAKMKETINQEWFHGFLSNAEAERLLEPCEVGTFLVRFSRSDPGSFAINLKSATGSIGIKVDTTPNGFVVKEGNSNTLRTFPSVPSIIQNYSSLLQTPFKEKIVTKPWFYGDFTLDETVYFLSDEPIGTYLLRFSTSQPCTFTVSVVRQEGIMHYRLERLPGGKILYEDQVYADIDEFLKMNKTWCQIPFENDNAVSYTQSEDDAKRQRYMPVILVNDEDNLKGLSKNNLVTYKIPYLGVEEAFAALLQKSISQELTQDETRLLTDHLLAAGSEGTDKATKKYHKKYCDEAVKRKALKRDRLASIPQIKFSSLFLQEKGADLYKSVKFEINFFHSFKSKVTWKILNPVDINRAFFLACNIHEGSVDRKENVNIRITCCLFKPIVLKYLLAIQFKVDDFEEIYRIPIRVVCNKDAVFQGSTGDNDWWHIPREDVEIMKKLGGGASAAVFLSSLYGAQVACKNWDLGKRDAPPRDFLAELSVFKSLKHDNLLMFIGGACEPGNAFLISEFAKLGSLDSYIANNRGKLSFPQRIQFAIEAAKGMCFLHNNNRVHRDLKSLNLLVTIMDKQTVVKVADFGESRTAQENMTIAAGTYNWMAPEVLTSRTYTQKADVFSFGIILWELLTTTLPERNPQDVAEGRIPPIPPEYEEKYPEYVALIRSCCRQNPNKRPSFQTLVIKLKQCKKKYQALMKN
jgi:hypothetical protein